jgi:hypothetical protein
LADAFKPPCAVAEGAVPCFNTVVDNNWCNVNQWMDVPVFSAVNWSSSVESNEEVACRYPMEPSNVSFHVSQLTGPAPPRLPSCAGETLFNGVCLPLLWPPRVELSREPPTPHYLSAPPAVIRIDLGRQLLVDGFLIASTNNTRRRWYQAKLLRDINPVLRPSEPWETVIDSGVAETAFSRGFSGGVWWDPLPAEGEDRGMFKLWYGCGAGEMPHFHQGTLRATCIATSTDARAWTKPRLTVAQCGGSATCVPGTNIVHNVSYAGNVVWLDLEETNQSQRYKMIEDFGPDHGSCSGACGCPFRLLSSPDGLRWSLRKTVGCSEDRASGFYNPFRRRWVFSIKAGGSDLSAATHSLQPFNRHRHYAETPTSDLFGDGVGFDANPADPASGNTYAWANADKLDRGWLGEREGWDQWPYGALYTVDGVAYESLMVFSFTNFRCKDRNPGCRNVSHGVHPEYDSIDLAFSRDGFSYSRPPAGEPADGVGVMLDPSHRVPFVPMSPQQNPSDWNYGSVQSIGGGFIIPGVHGADDTMLVFVGAGAGHSFQDLNATSSIGVASLRRDGRFRN